MSEGTDEGNDSADEALRELLGLSSLDVLGQDVATETQVHQVSGRLEDLARVSDNYIDEVMKTSNVRNVYSKCSCCILPPELSVSATLMRRMTDEIIWDQNPAVADRSYEQISVISRTKDGECSLQQKRTLTRLENFVDKHEGWNLLCNDYLRRCVSSLLGEPQVLYKEKLNLKPPGGSGFAPHLDTPSLRIALGDKGPQNFSTVMVAIDNMSVRNGCLRVSKGSWTEDNACQVVLPEENGNPDGSGRAGALLPNVADSLDFEDLECSGGSIAIFNGWAPHRSSANGSPFPRRAIFLTYNAQQEGEFRLAYYEQMQRLRNDWRESVGLPREMSLDEKADVNALATVPKI